jgi:hypothetical protein
MSLIGVNSMLFVGVRQGVLCAVGTEFLFVI